MSSSNEIEITKIIDSLVTSGKKVLDETSMKKLKSICKSSNEYVYFTYNALLTQLRKEHAEVRYSSLLIINELFQRSSVFRKLLEKDLEEFLELVAESDPDQPLPPPQDAAKALKLKSVEFLQVWTSKFGDKCVRLELALTYLQQCIKVDFSDMEARSVAERERIRQEQEKQERFMIERINKIKAEIQEMTDEISNKVLQMENCFKLLVPHPTEFFSFDDFSATEEQGLEHCKEENEVENSLIQSESNESKLTADENSMRHHGLHSMRNTITIEIKENPELSVKVNEDNQPIIENLKDLYKEINTRHFSAVKRWLKILTKGNNCTDILKKAIDLKQLIESVFDKYNELRIRNDFGQVDFDDDDDEDDDFIEVEEKEGYEATPVAESCIPASLSQPTCSKTLTDAEKASKWKLIHSQEDIKDPTSAASTLVKRILKHSSSERNVFTKPESKKKRKKELFEKAPVLPYDIDLYHWEEEKLVAPEKIKYDLDKFWLSRDDDDESEALKEFQIASLRTRKIDFSGKFEPVKWSCRAPLPNGKLCPRKDRIKCPFHGVIVKRDDSGKPIDSSNSIPGPSTSTTSEVPDWQDPSLLKDIEAATGVNLKIPQKKSRGKKKECGLTNIKQKKNSVRNRLSKKIIKGYAHCAKKLDEIERKRFNDKFGDQWNYY